MSTRNNDTYFTGSFWIVIGLGSLVVLTLFISGNVLIVGERLARVSPSLEIGFYCLIVVLLYLLLIRPLLPVLIAPEFPLQSFLAESEIVSTRLQRSASRRLLKHGRLPLQLHSDLAVGLKAGDTLLPALKNAIDHKVTSANEIVRNHAQLAFLSTAVSQNGSLDAVMLVYTNFKLIGALVEHFGFRPSLLRLIKLYAQVFTAALIAERIEDMELEEIVPQLTASAGGGFSSWAGLQLVAAAILQGMGSAFLTLRTGYLVHEYIMSGEEKFDRRLARGRATKKAAKNLFPVMAGAVGRLPSSIRTLLKPLSWLFKEQKPSQAASTV